MSQLAHMGEMLATYARLCPDKIGAGDLDRKLTFQLWHRRACRLANALAGIGLGKGDRVCVLAYNCLEWLEVYAAAALAGVVVVPINFRLTGMEVRYIVENCEARALVVQDELLGVVDGIRAELSVPSANFIHFGTTPCPAGYRAYEELLGQARDSRPSIDIDNSDPWTLMYTSGTTGRPKGAIRNHKGGAVLSLVTEVELGISRNDAALLVMPMCHANSLYFFVTFLYLGATVVVDDHRSFDAEALLATLAREHVTFTSLVPTHYIMMLGLPEATKARYDVSAVGKLLISSAPARADTKRAILAHFANSRLFELYGATETGWVTILRPDEQIERLGSVGREWAGSGAIRLLDIDGREVTDGDVGELFSRTSYVFDGYWKNPEKTAEAFRDGWCSVGDMARRDDDGYIRLVDRKSNMIISGGENVYPSEVEAVIGAHPQVEDVAVIGLPDAKWGEAVCAVVVVRAGGALSEDAVVAWCRERMAGYKRPRSVVFMAAAEMPRTATGKILHRTLRERLAAKAEGR
jgi:acyl-CoA synthetase (AMP-forming)/AMP-acid ligase II